MTAHTATPCLRCCTQTVRPHAKPGRTARWLILPAVAVPAGLEISSCSRCGCEYPTPEQRANLDRELTASGRAILRKSAADAIRALSPAISQRRLELLLGISQGYLSRLLGSRRSRTHTPSPALVALLALLASEPALLRWIERYWVEQTIRDKQSEH